VLRDAAIASGDGVKSRNLSSALGEATWVGSIRTWCGACLFAQGAMQGTLEYNQDLFRCKGTLAEILFEM
jgi:hypothetical protein